MSTVKPRSLSPHLRWLALFTHRISLGMLSALLLTITVGCAAGGAGSASLADPAITSFTATPETIIKGTQTILNWSTNETTGVSFSISDGSGNLSNANSTPLSSTSLGVSPAATTTYTMKTTNQSGKTDTATVVVTVVDRPVISSFTASPSLIAGAQSTTLSWSVSGATSLSINHGVGDVTGSTSVSVSPAVTTTYTLTAKSGSGTTSAITLALTTVTVVPRPVISNFTARPSTISSGQHSTLSWSVTGATGVSIDNGVGTVTNQTSVNVSPTATTAYTLTAINTVGSFTATNTAQATVTFSSAAVPAISSFGADHPSVGPNGLATLTANFDLGQGGGTATITTGDGAPPVAQGSSSPLVATVSLPSSTTFTLTVKNVDGNATTAATRVLAGSNTSFAGVVGSAGNLDGTGASARFSSPNGMAVDASGTLYVVDNVADPLGNYNIIRLVTTPGAVVTTLIDSGTGLPVRLTNGPAGMAVDLQGNIYVADTNNHTIDVIAPGGTLTILAGTPGIPGSNDSPDALFDEPLRIAVDNSGNLYVTDSRNDTIRKITPAGIVTTLAGTAGVTGSNDSPNAHFSGLFGIAVNSSTGNLYVTDGNTVRMITPGGEVSTLAGSPGQRGHADGTGAAATFNGPNDVVLDPSGNIYVADVLNFTIRKVTPDGIVSTIIGVPGSGSANPGGPLPGKLSVVNGMVASPVSNGNLYFDMRNAIFTAPY